MTNIGHRIFEVVFTSKLFDDVLIICWGYEKLSGTGNITNRDITYLGTNQTSMMELFSR